MKNMLGASPEVLAEREGVGGKRVIECPFLKHYGTLVRTDVKTRYASYV